MDFGAAGLGLGCLGGTLSLGVLGMELGALGVDLVALEVDHMPWRWMSNWYRVGVDLGAIELAPSLLAQACIPTEHGPRIFASSGRSSLEEVVLEAP